MSRKRTQNTGEEAKLPLRHSLNLSAHFRVWVGVWVGFVPHPDPHTKAAKKQRKSPVFSRKQDFLELLGGFEPPTSSLPTAQKPSSRCYIRVLGAFCPKRDEVRNSLFHCFRSLVFPCGSRCGSAPQATSVWANFRWRGNGHILRCWKQ